MSFSAKQRRVARLLGNGMSEARAGQRTATNPRTIRRWLTDVPGFAELVSRETKEQRDPTATETLLDLLNDDDPKVRLASAQTLYRQADPDPPPIDQDPHEIRATVRLHG